MKKMLFVLIPVLTVFLTLGCSTFDDDWYKPNVSLDTSSDIIVIGNTSFKRPFFEAANFIKLVNNRYVWELSDNDALKMGLSLDDISNMRNELELANNQIAIWEESKTPFSLTDPEKVLALSIDEIVSLTTTVKTRSETTPGTKPSGRISTIGQETGGDSFFAPSGSPSVTFRCWANAAILPIFNVSTTALGVTNTGGGISFVGFGNNITVDLAASNTYVSVSFSISDSNGGGCNWQCN